MTSSLWPFLPRWALQRSSPFAGSMRLGRTLEALPRPDDDPLTSVLRISLTTPRRFNPVHKEIQLKIRSPQLPSLTPGSIGAVVAMLLLATAPVASAANLLTNPGFDTGLTSWTVNGATWTPSDALGLAGSGSATGTNNASGPFTYVNVLTSACISVSAGQTYAASLDYLLPSGQTQRPEAEVQVSWYGSGGCGGGSFITSNVFVEGAAADGQWHRLGSSSAAAAPATAEFALVELSVIKLNAGGSAVAFFDNAVFRTSGSCAELPDVLCLQD